MKLTFGIHRYKSLSKHTQSLKRNAMNAVACKTTRGHMLNSGIAKFTFSISTVVMYHGMHVICFAFAFSLSELACYIN